MSEEVVLQESCYQPSELAKSIGAIFLPADWRRWTYSHYQQLEMIDQLLHTVQPPTADAVVTAKEIVARWKRDIGQVVKYERMEADITTALSAAEQRGRDERNEFLQQVLRATAEEEVNLHVSSGLLKAISIIRSNQ